MDLRRNFLIIGLAVVSYLMVLAWNEDYGQTEPLAQSTVSTAQESSLTDAQDIGASVRSQAKDDSVEFTPPEAKGTAIASITFYCFTE